MFELNVSGATAAERYAGLAEQAAALLQGESDLVANAANFAAIVYHGVEGLNWAGFYFLKGNQLVVGPFQGQPACVRIPLGRGVCGTAAAERRTVVVDDVDAFPGHIACDAASRSEIVVPLIVNGELIGVFDIDSPRPHRFSTDDQAGIEALVARFVQSLNQSQ